ncbi:peptide-methionine (R)-S-oxide reductase MsrB [Anaerorhabdus furcosa]|uniref:Peptide methionine sulfoxide reductase MsrA n=1 Tax=Anaerorhabdus furcosa TaxID=118967 RepID=A0A1T4KI60_9FIRM|nr:peptide-methionine (R)-S-oxide reductase MsrB [Anaerorhabdus furcosa]SJZ42109.1 peptide methionine sulfoxide reductase msrA/msrB [Anaerorhabdus furcosa]
MKKIILALIVVASFMLSSCTTSQESNEREVYDISMIGKDASYEKKEGTEIIYLAGGCFWGIEKLVQSIPGVISGISGYANGKGVNPTYQQVSNGNTGFRETVRVEYDPNVVSLEKILYAYFSVIDPTIENRQGNDIGTQYQTGVYYADENSMNIVKEVVENEKSRVANFMVEVKPLESFYEAEEYHQDYLDKNPQGYCHIPQAKFDKVKKMMIDPAEYTKPAADEISKNLSPMEYQVTQKAATEKPFSHEYDELFDDGIYVDIVTGEPLFSSRDKYDSGCGWPAFTKTIDESTVVEKKDSSLGMVRTEVVSRVGNSHLGHKFEGDSTSPNGIRYCINGSSLKFIPKDEMEKEGYGDLLSLFE